MNRLQKKCLIAVAGTHLLLVVVFFCSGFIRPTPKEDDIPVLTMIPSTAIDKELQSGVREATPPPPTPPVQPHVEPTPPTPTPPPPKPDVQPPEPPKHIEPVAPVEPKEPDITKPVVRPEPKPPKHEIKVDLTKVNRNTAADKAAAEAEKAAQDRKRQQDRQKAINNALNKIKENSTSATTVDMPGTSTVAYANYAAIVKTVYTEAWTPPDSADSDTANVKVSVTIARDGTVIESHIVTPSGDSSVDRSVQSTLDRVTNIRPFPDDSTDKQRTYIINFNLKAKRMLG